jgi:adenosine deaminase
MPKVELHAHLNGSISAEILSKLSGRSDVDVFANLAPDLAKCFELFGKIHEVIRTGKILKSVTREIIRDFARDNVVYLELRTTPKKVHEIRSKEEYLENVLQGILEMKDELPIIVKLLISIDRKMGALEGSENVDLAINWFMKYPELVVGLDLSGDPRQGSHEWIIPLLARAREHGLQISCHLPEVINLEETTKFYEFKPERVGHALFIHPSFGGTPQLWKTAKLTNIPIEACITSNVITGLSSSLQEHYVKLIHEAGMPYAVCTDDSGVFQTTLSQEYIKLLKIVSLDPNQLQDLCLRSVDYSFASQQEKQELKSRMMQWWRDLDLEEVNQTK